MQARAGVRHDRAQAEHARRVVDGQLLPDLPEATVLTAGYVLDAAEMAIERMALVCHIGSRVHYVLDLPGGAASVPAPTQLTMVPLSAPIIRSARAAAAQRLAQRASGDA